MLLSVFVEVLLPVAVVVACGYALRRAFPIDLQSLNRVSLYVFGPALIFVTLARINVPGDEGLRIASASVLFVLIIGAITWLIARLLQLDRPRTAGLLLCVMFMNSGNFGLPTTRFAFGDEGFQRALLYFIPQTIMAQLLAIPIARSASGSNQGAFRQILRMPQIYAALLGILVAATGFQLDGRHDLLGSAFRGVALLADATLPFLLLLLGMQLALGVEIEDRGLTMLAVGLRLGVSPFLAYAIGWSLGLRGLSLDIVILEASMPTAVNMVLFAMEFGARPRFVAGVVVVSTVVALVTLTVLLGLIR